MQKENLRKMQLESVWSAPGLRDRRNPRDTDSHRECGSVDEIQRIMSLHKIRNAKC